MNLIKIDRKSQITTEEFEEMHLRKNIPVIITDGMKNWDIKTTWTLEYLLKNYGEEEVQLYDDLFNLMSIVSLSDYINQFCGRELSSNDKTIPYVRWYTRLKDNDFVWSDHFFDKIKNSWDLPYFLPDKNYLLPYSNKQKKLNPSNHMFPAKGIFISAKGAKTRLHYDPWCSDAILCQIYGRKKVVLYHPSQKEFLYQENEFADIENPNLNKFLRFNQAKPAFSDVLNPGEIIFFPHNWLHHVSTIEDSISITWNFVHISTWNTFFNYLINNPELQDLEVIKFFLNN